MRCNKCGFINEDFAKYCAKCGTPLHRTHQKQKYNMRKKQLVIMSFILFFTLLCVAGVILFQHYNKKSQYEAKVRLGDKYTDSSDYKEASQAYEEALNINPTNMDLYNKLAETYEKMMEWNKAIEIMGKASENVSGYRDEIQNRISKIQEIMAAEDTDFSISNYISQYNGNWYTTLKGVTRTDFVKIFEMGTPNAGTFIIDKDKIYEARTWLEWDPLLEKSNPVGIVSVRNVNDSKDGVTIGEEDREDIVTDKCLDVGDRIWINDNYLYYRNIKDEMIELNLDNMKIKVISSVPLYYVELNNREWYYIRDNKLYVSQPQLENEVFISDVSSNSAYYVKEIQSVFFMKNGNEIDSYSVSTHNIDVYITDVEDFMVQGQDIYFSQKNQNDTVNLFSKNIVEEFLEGEQSDLKEAVISEEDCIMKVPEEKAEKIWVGANGTEVYLMRSKAYVIEADMEWRSSYIFGSTIELGD